MNRTYRLSLHAESDLKEIAAYTLEKWGAAKFAEYRDGLINVFDRIAANSTVRKAVSPSLPDVFVTKYNLHFIFYLLEEGEAPVILGVIHEKRDVVNRLHDRLK